MFLHLRLINLIMKITYNPALTELARKLRNNMTFAEITVWRMVKGKHIEGYDFHRQKPIGEYIADFYCHDLSLVLEIDGISHENEKVRWKDQLKENYFSSIGLTALRFTNDEVLGNARLVELRIRDYALVKKI